MKPDSAYLVVTEMKDKQIQKISKELSILLRSYNRLCDDIERGEHITKEWLTGAIEEASRDHLVEILNRELNRVKKEKQDLEKEFSSMREEVAAVWNILVSEGLEYKHKARLERICERSTEGVKNEN